MKEFDVVVLGAGPGGYIAAIRAAQLKKKVAIIEEDKLGGVCLNRGCIPTKALLKAAHAVHELSEMKSYGIDVEVKGLDAKVAVQRAAKISDMVGKGVAFLMKKNNIEVIAGRGQFKDSKTLDVKMTDGSSLEVKAEKIIIATGAHYRSFPGLTHDGDRLIGAWEALKMEEMPKSIAIIGAGAIGVEMAYFWNAYGVEVHIFEVQKHLLPLEDDDCSSEVERAYKKLKIKMSLGIEKVTAKNNGDSVTISTVEKGEAKDYQFDKCLIAVGMTGNVEGIGLERIGVEVERGFIKVDSAQRTNIPGIYAIGDVSGGMLLAHAASHEGIIAAEDLAGLKTHGIVMENVAGCTYCQPQVASVGLRERQLKEKGIEYKVGKLPFRANGKALASDEKEGFIKVLTDNQGKLLGAHIVGNIATELIHEYAVMKSQGLQSKVITETIHPHPTLGEFLPEALLAAEGLALNA